MELICPVQEYEWGKVGSRSLVAQLKQSGDLQFQIDENKTYAELWMGTHPNGPAVVKELDSPLSAWLQKNASKLGEASVKAFGKKLPFLFKVLSVNKPLSIQTHPSKAQAEELHSKFPDVYKDANAKPEMAIAISKFETLCGFRPILDIRHFLNVLPELVHLIGSDKTEQFLYCREDEQLEKLALIFEALIRAPETEVKGQLKTFLSRLGNAKRDQQEKYHFDLVNRIHKYFPNDVGCFCVFLLNYRVLKPGEAFFLEAQQPHAYISGDCIECMAGSDNVVRAALTPKPRDVDTLCKILNYTPCEGGSSNLVKPIKENNHSTLYKPPAKQFAVCRVEVQSGLHYDLKCRDSASIFIVLEGHAKIGGRNMCRGQIFLIGAGEIHTIEVPINSETLVLFQAFVNV